MESALVRIRPFRFAFLVEPKDKKALQRVFEMTSSLWGGIFNYIVPLFKQVPDRYKQEYQKPISAKTMINGFVEAFQPDYVVETRDGQCAEYCVDFPVKRTTSFAELLSRGDEDRCQIGVDLRSFQFHFGDFSDLYGVDAQMARGMFMRGEITDFCEFTQRLYVGMPSSHEVRQEKMRKRAAKKQAKAVVASPMSAQPKSAHKQENAGQNPAGDAAAE